MYIQKWISFVLCSASVQNSYCERGSTQHNDNGCFRDLANDVFTAVLLVCLWVLNAYETLSFFQTCRMRCVVKLLSTTSTAWEAVHQWAAGPVKKKPRAIFSFTVLELNNHQHWQATVNWAEFCFYEENPWMFNIIPTYIYKIEVNWVEQIISMVISSNAGCCAGSVKL